MIRFNKITFPLKKPVLNSISSKIYASKMLGILGPSGCGKTTLIKILSGRQTQKFAGEIFFDDKKTTKSQRQRLCAYVHQDDVLHSNLTVRETIRFYERLLNLKCQNLMGLENILDERIGTGTSGISAGERKRLSILLSLLEKKEIIFLDEPTSNLDTLNAINLMDMLREIEGTKIRVVHQPSSEIFFRFDDLIIMLQGQIVYEGKSKDIWLWFQDLGLECPKFTNPADFITTDVFPKIQEKYNLSTVKFPTFIPLDSNNQETSPSNAISLKLKKRKKNSFFKELLIMLGRNLKILARNKGRMYSRIFQSLFIGIGLGFMYFKTYKQEKKVCKETNICLLLYFICLSSFITSTTSSLTEHFSDQRVLYREYQNRYFRYRSSFIAKVIVDLLLTSMNAIIVIPMVALLTQYNLGLAKLLILGLNSLITSFTGYALTLAVSSFCATTMIANTILSCTLIPLTLINGSFVHKETELPILKILKQISPIFFSIRIALQNEFQLEDLDTNLDHFKKYEDQIKSSFKMIQSFSILFTMTFLGLLCGFLILKYKINKKI